MSSRHDAEPAQADSSGPAGESRSDSSSRAGGDPGGGDSGGRDSGGGDSGGGDEGVVNFDEAALVEVELDGTDYRLDSGRAGTALCISTRPTGSWSWTFRGEAKWQAKVLKCKAFDRVVLARLSQALAELSASDA